MLISKPLRYITIITVSSFILVIALTISNDPLILNAVIVFAVAYFDFTIPTLTYAIYVIIVSDFNWAVFIRRKAVAPFMAVFVIVLLLCFMIWFANVHGYASFVYLVKHVSAYIDARV